ncbi:TetR/AcrR family transcriptional regulator [Pseudonocardia sp. MH-G8]|uniref:TetR/AcrR family transcriptional regulator n=1 Tax=Pseudonocardia sp. MH-G8 TaxID=1854588 RepID=UPI000B9FCF35|nr:TetR/AcrR family transcriptional regulator [Pseudonocardia sp. MH-G8]OZM75792.1 TetR family transcriptional regulator [Pseudonocardia sp. MH-G8]
MPAPGTSTKSSQRRRAVLEAAVACFARKGFYGTTTQEIAERAGISQPYLYRLFTNKQALFASVIHHVSELIATTLAAQVADAAQPPRSPAEALHVARTAYTGLIEDRDILMFLMQANCAADEPLVGDAARSCYARQTELVRELLGNDEEAVRQWFGAGMLANVVTALGLPDIDEPWARTLSGR